VRTDLHVTFQMFEQPVNHKAMISFGLAVIRRPGLGKGGLSAALEFQKGQTLFQSAIRYLSDK